ASGWSGGQPSRQSATTSTSGSSRARARTAVDFAVPFSPRMSTPPIAGLIALSTSDCFIDSWPTSAVKGKMVRAGPEFSFMGGILAERARSPGAELLLHGLEDRPLGEVVEAEVATSQTPGEVEAGV